MLSALPIQKVVCVMRGRLCKSVCLWTSFLRQTIAVVYAKTITIVCECQAILTEIDEYDSLNTS